MILMQSLDKFDDLADLDINTGYISWFSRRANPAVASRPIHGHIAQLHGRILCLYRRGGVLHFRVDGEDFELTKNTSVNLERVRHDTNRIIVTQEGTLLFSWTYQRRVVFPPLELDPTPFVEEEDFDFCLFVYNVANDPERRERIYTDCI
jgi:hypothetical protein